MKDILNIIFQGNKFGLFLLMIGVFIPFYSTSITNLFLKRKWKKANDYRKKMIEYDKDPFSKYFICQQAYYDLCINFVCFLIFLLGLVLLVV